MEAPSSPPRVPEIRVRAFVDFWNFQLAVHENISKAFRIDWKALGPWLARQAGVLAAATGDTGLYKYDGMHVYLSTNPKNRRTPLLESGQATFWIASRGLRLS